MFYKRGLEVGAYIDSFKAFCQPHITKSAFLFGRCSGSLFSEGYPAITGRNLKLKMRLGPRRWQVFNLTVCVIGSRGEFAFENQTLFLVTFCASSKPLLNITITFSGEGNNFVSLSRDSGSIPKLATKIIVSSNNDSVIQLIGQLLLRSYFVSTLR